MPRPSKGNNARPRRRNFFLLLVGLTLVPLFIFEFRQPPVLAATTFTVNSTGDGADSDTGDGVCKDGAGSCTLRAAIQQANATTGTDTIAFQIPGSGVRTIAPATGLPAVTDPAIIDGYTQAGASPNTLADGDDAVLLIELSGATAGAPGGLLTNGLTITAGNSVVRGLVINRFAGAGLSLGTAGQNLVEGNFIGTNAAGTAAAPNGEGIRINAPSSTGNGNVIGGTTPAARNVISGNGGVGLNIQGSAGATRVQGNYIGTDAGGTSKLGNGSHGVSVNSAANVIGGTAAGARNVISGNGQAGLYLQPISSPGNTVQGNYIGTDVTGTAALGNHFVGVWINFGLGQSIGGAEAAAANVISGNEASGVLLTGDLSRNNQIGGNFIGTDASGTRPLGNKSDGIRISDFARDNFVQQQGPSAPMNTIAYNGGHGIAVYPPGAGNTIRRNNIFSNGALGIEVNGDGIGENDGGDTDGGANNGQNYPLVTSFTSSGGTTNVQGTLNSTPNTVFAIELFTNSGCDPNGFGEGARFFGTAGVTTGANGNATFNVNIPQALPAGRVITATATRNSAPRDTSEFSPCSEAGAAGSVEFAHVPPTYNFSEDIGDAPIRVNRVGGSTGVLTVSYATTPGTATEGADYTAATGTITFADGETTKTFAVPVANEGVVEPDETIGLALFSTTNPEAVGARNRATLNLVDGSKTPTVGFTAFTSALGEELSGTRLAHYTVGLSAGTSRTVSVHLQTADGTATAGADYEPLSLDLVFAPGEVSKEVAVVINGDTLAEPPNETFFVRLFNSVNATLATDEVQVTIIDNDTPALRFAAQGFITDEGAHAFGVTVLRSGVSTGTLAVDYATSDGTATERGDYTTALGTLRFAPGEMQKTFTVLVTDDAFQEGDETINLTLSNPAGGAFIDVRGFVGAVLVGQGTATLTITDNDPAPSSANPIDDTPFFVRQHYADFLNRGPDASGLAFWVNDIEQCGADAVCREVKRINVSAAFFLSIEFQQTGYLAYRARKAAFGNIAGKPVPITRDEMLQDVNGIGNGVVVNADGWEQRLEQNKRAYFDQVVASERFASLYPQALTPEQFVDALNTNAGGSLSPSERNTLVGDLKGGAKTRAQVLRSVAEDADLAKAELNRAFVLMQYFGYLRRDPDSSPDSDFSGFNHWLGKLNEFNGNFINAEMVKAFISADEYRKRFGQ